MALPVNNAPKYRMVLPSTQEEYYFKPFLMKQEKALMLAMQSEDQKQMVATLTDVITECFEGKIDVKNVAMFDLEYIFAQLRSKSVGETVALTMKCKQCDPEDEKARIRVEVNLADINVEFPENQDPKIMLWDDVGVQMRYPSVEILEKMDAIKNPDDPESLYAVISACMDFIFTAEEVFKVTETPPSEVKDFLDNLTNDQFMKIKDFFDQMPKMSKQIDYACPKCGHAHSQKIEGLNAFFM